MATSTIKNSMLDKSTTSFTPISGSAYSGYGGCYYKVWGRLVQVHIGMQGLTANTATQIFTLPSGVRPPTGQCVGLGLADGMSRNAKVRVDANGLITVISEATYASVDVFYLI